MARRTVVDTEPEPREYTIDEISGMFRGPSLDLGQLPKQWTTYSLRILFNMGKRVDEGTKKAIVMPTGNDRGLSVNIDVPPKDGEKLFLHKIYYENENSLRRIGETIYVIIPTGTVLELRPEAWTAEEPQKRIGWFRALFGGILHRPQKGT